MNFGEYLEGDWDYNIESISAETDKAWLISIGGGEYWLPKSICKISQDQKMVTIPEWLAKKHGLM